MGVDLVHNSCPRREKTRFLRVAPSGRPGARLDGPVRTRKPGPERSGETEPEGLTLPNWSETVDRAQKEKVVEELGQIFESSGVVVVAHYTGLTVAKNRLAKIALEGKPCASMADLLTGMTVLTYSEDPVAAAKVAEDFAKENKKFEILGGAMGETSLERAGVTAVSKMPSREELIASIVGCIGAPASNIAGAIGAPASNIASIFSSIEEKAEAA